MILKRFLFLLLPFKAFIREFFIAKYVDLSGKKSIQLIFGIGISYSNENGQIINIRKVVT